MSDLEEQEFDDEPRTIVMQEELLTELTARSRSDAAAVFADEPTAVAKVSAAEILAAAGLGATIEQLPSAPQQHHMRALRLAAVVLLAAALVAWLVVRAVQHRLPL